MAKRIIDWTLDDNGVLSLNRYNSDKDAEIESLKTFDLVKLYPNWTDYNEVQKHLIEYGVKQKLADAGASEIGDADGKVEKATELFGYFLENKLHGARVNASSDDKKRLKSMKTAAKVVSLDGLMAKKLLAPDQFTEADQAKLDEFMEMAVKAKSKPKTKKK